MVEIAGQNANIKVDYNVAATTAAKTPFSSDDITADISPGSMDVCELGAVPHQEAREKEGSQHGEATSGKEAIGDINVNAHLDRKECELLSV